jgi:hypothetical protein
MPIQHGMRRTFTVLLATASLAWVSTGTALGGRSASASLCADANYAYAGVQSNTVVTGVAASVTALSRPQVVWGHVGGWIGVGGQGKGPGGADEWIQVGLSSFKADRTSRIYYEIVRPGAERTYVQVRASVKVGTSHRLSIRELPTSPGRWRVYVDGRAVSPIVLLPGSHGRWHAQVVGESWNAGRSVCNHFDYGFADATVLAGRWTALANGGLLENAGYRITRSGSDAFRAHFTG